MGSWQRCGHWKQFLIQKQKDVVILQQQIDDLLLVRTLELAELFVRLKLRAASSRLVSWILRTLQLAASVDVLLNLIHALEEEFLQLVSMRDEIGAIVFKFSDFGFFNL